jgi:hypothetical protein
VLGEFSKGYNKLRDTVDLDSNAAGLTDFHVRRRPCPSLNPYESVISPAPDLALLVSSFPVRVLVLA